MWLRVYQAQLSAIGCSDALSAVKGQEVKVRRNAFSSEDISPDRLRKANQVWVSLMAHCEGVALEIVSGTESSSEAWAQLLQHYRASGLKKRRILTIVSYRMNPELRENPSSQRARARQPACRPRGCRCGNPERVD